MRTFMDKHLKYFILLLAASSCLYGACTGEMQQVLGKAVQICLECCGIG